MPSEQSRTINTTATAVAHGLATAATNDDGDIAVAQAAAVLRSALDGLGAPTAPPPAKKRSTKK